MSTIRNARSRYMLIVGVVLLSGLACVAWWSGGVRFLADLVTAEARARERLTCGRGMFAIGVALQQYHDDYGVYPPPYIADQDGKPAHSWRVLLLPYLDQTALYACYHFDEPWDRPNNRRMAGLRVRPFGCPSDPASACGMTSYVAVVGTVGAWPEQGGRRRDDMVDGGENTILLVEVVDSGIHWSEPRDLHIVQMAQGVNAQMGQGPSSRHRGGAHALFAGGGGEALWRRDGDEKKLPLGEVRFLENNMSPQRLIEAISIRAGETQPDLP